MKDYYKILGVNKNSSSDDIKMAYKKLAMKYHPDRNPNDSKCEEKFKDIKEAYEFLTNKNKTSSFNDFNSNINFGDFSNSESSLDDIFNVIFKKGFKKNIKTYFLLDIDLECSIYGCSTDIKIPYQGICLECSGKGLKQGSDLKICYKCGGSGYTTIMQGIFNFKQKCYKCEGKGYVSTENCNFCFGLGKINKMHFSKIFINKNTDNNFQIPLNFKTENYKDINYIILIKVKPHPLFVRKNIKNNDLYIDLYLDFIKSILGGFLKIFTVYGFLIYKILKYNQNNKVYKIGGFGLNFNNKFGDLYINTFVEIICNLNFYQWFLLNKLRLSIDFNKNYFLIFKIEKHINSFYNLVLNT